MEVLWFRMHNRRIYCLFLPHNYHTYQDFDCNKIVFYTVLEISGIMWVLSFIRLSSLLVMAYVNVSRVRRNVVCSYCGMTLKENNKTRHSQRIDHRLVHSLVYEFIAGLNLIIYMIVNIDNEIKVKFTRESWKLPKSLFISLTKNRTIPTPSL